jgi:hypothetical protein
VSDARHHHASREIIFVPVPVLVEVPEAGSPKNVRAIKPDPHPPDRLPPWRPAQRLPRLNKAERLAKWLDAMRRQDAELKAYMRPDPAALRAWLSRGEVLV